MYMYYKKKEDTKRTDFVVNATFHSIISVVLYTYIAIKVRKPVTLKTINKFFSQEGLKIPFWECNKTLA